MKIKPPAPKEIKVVQNPQGLQPITENVEDERSAIDSNSFLEADPYIKGFTGSKPPPLPKQIFALSERNGND